MGRNSNPNANPLLAWLHNQEARDRISRLNRQLGFEKPYPSVPSCFPASAPPKTHAKTVG